jgi:hypothetical protein
MPERGFVPSMDVDDHDVPSYFRALPTPSTATQNEAPEHETLVRAFVPSIDVGDDHDVPSYVRALPA